MKTKSRVSRIKLIVAAIMACTLPIAAAPNTVNIAGDVNAPGNGSGLNASNSLPGAMSLAGKTVTNPLPGGIPAGSTIFGIDKFGDVDFLLPGGGSSSAHIAGLTLASFMVVGGTTGLTMDSGVGAGTSTFKADEQVGLTGGTTTGDDFVTLVGDFGPSPELTLNQLYKEDEKDRGAFVDFFLSSWFGPDYVVGLAGGGGAAPPGMFPEPPAPETGSVGFFDGAASNAEVVPVVGDLGGPIDSPL